MDERRCDGCGCFEDEAGEDADIRWCDECGHELCWCCRMSWCDWHEDDDE